MNPTTQHEPSNLESKDSKLRTLLMDSGKARTHNEPSSAKLSKLDYSTTLNNEPVEKQSFSSATLSGKNKVFPDNEPTNRPYNDVISTLLKYDTQLSDANEYKPYSLNNQPNFIDENKAKPQVTSGLRPLPSVLNKTLPQKTYLVKIDEDFKIINSSFDSNLLLELIHKIYCVADITVYELPQKNYSNVLNKLKIKDSFIQNNILNPDEFCNNLVKFANLDYYFTNFSTLESDNTITVKEFERNEINPNQLDATFDNHLEKHNEVVPYDKEEYADLRVNSLYELSKDSETFVKSYSIYFNNMRNNIIMFPFSLNQVKELFPEFVEIYSGKITEEQYGHINELMNEVYVNADDAKACLNNVINEKELCTKLSFTEIKRLIKKYFDLNNNIENKIKFTNIWNIVTKNFNISEEYVGYYKHQLPIVLEEMGLSKKRYSDGMYWYGLIEKSENNNDQNVKELPKPSKDVPLTDDEYIDKISSRELQSTQLKDSIKNGKVVDMNLRKLFNAS